MVMRERDLDVGNQRKAGRDVYHGGQRDGGGHEQRSKIPIAAPSESMITAAPAKPVAIVKMLRRVWLSTTRRRFEKRSASCPAMGHCRRYGPKEDSRRSEQAGCRSCRGRPSMLVTSRTPPGAHGNARFMFIPSRGESRVAARGAGKFSKEMRMMRPVTRSCASFINAIWRWHLSP